MFYFIYFVPTDEFLSMNLSFSLVIFLRRPKKNEYDFQSRNQYMLLCMFQDMFGVLLSFILVQCCLCSEWRQDSYLDAYTESEGTVFEGPYPQYPRMPMKNATTVSMMPFLLQLILIIAKIMLKFTIFKIIVKFIAVVCLFLFIPTLRLPKARDAGRSGNLFTLMYTYLNCYISFEILKGYN